MPVNTVKGTIGGSSHSVKGIYRILQRINTPHFIVFERILEREVIGVIHRDLVFCPPCFGRDQDHTKSSLSTVNRSRSRIFQYGNRLHIIRVYILDAGDLHVIQQDQRCAVSLNGRQRSPDPDGRIRTYFTAGNGDG
ncbi:hypothetical protein FQZ97_1144730 [compost metagenome]